MRPILLGALALTAAGADARAQGFGDPLLTATISQSVVADTNFSLDDPSPGTSYFADTRLALGLVNETPTQVFELGLDTGLRALWQAEEDFDLTFASPTTASLGYAQTWANAELVTDFSFRQTEVDGDRPLEDFLDSDGEFIEDALDRDALEVIERRYDGSVDLALATNAPSSYEFSLAGTRVDYDETSANRAPRTNLDGDARWLLRLNPVLSTAVRAGYAYYDAENARETRIRTSEFDAGVVYQPRETLGLDVGLGYADRRKEEIVGGDRVDDDRSGFLLRAEARYDFEAVVVTADVRYTQASVGSPFTGGLRAVYPLPRGQLTGRVFQRKGGAATGSETEVRGAGIGLLHEINTVSALNFDVAATRQADETAPFEADITRLAFTATYSRALTATVAANVGYRYRTFDQDPDDAVSNAVFFEIGRTFTSRF